MKLYIVFAGTLLLVLMFGKSSDGFDADKLDEEKATLMFNCISTIVCELYQGEELIVIAKAAGPEMREWGMKCMMSKYNITLPMDIDEYFKLYSEKVCVFPHKERQAAFKAFMMDVSKKIDEYCKDPRKKDECEKIMKAIEAGEKLIQEHTENGDCHNPQKGAEAAMEQGQAATVEDREKFEKGMKGMNPGDSPTFG